MSLAEGSNFMVDQQSGSPPNPTVETNLHSKPDYAEQLGHITAVWANLEWGMFNLFVEITGLPAALARNIFYSVESNRGRREMLSAAGLAVIQNKPLMDELTGLIGRIGRTGSVRNKYVHDTWGVTNTSANEVIQLRLSPKNSVAEMQEVTIKDLERSVEDIQAVVQAIGDYREKIAPRLPDWLGTLRAQPSLAMQFAKKGHPPGRKPKGHRSSQR